MTEKKKPEAAPKDDSPVQYIYTGSLPQTRVWDGQTIERDVPFTPRTDHCAKMCEGSGLFKTA